jgi:hypothetical protein
MNEEEEEEERRLGCDGQSGEGQGEGCCAAVIG